LAAEIWNPYLFVGRLPSSTGGEIEEPTVLLEKLEKQLKSRPWGTHYLAVNVQTHDVEMKKSSLEAKKIVAGGCVAAGDSGNVLALEQVMSNSIGDYTVVKKSLYCNKSTAPTGVRFWVVGMTIVLNPCFVWNFFRRTGGYNAALIVVTPRGNTEPVKSHAKLICPLLPGGEIAEIGGYFKLETATLVIARDKLGVEVRILLDLPSGPNGTDMREVSIEGDFLVVEEDSLKAGLILGGSKPWRTPFGFKCLDIIQLGGYVEVNRLGINFDLEGLVKLNPPEGSTSHPIFAAGYVGFGATVGVASPVAFACYVKSLDVFTLIEVTFGKALTDEPFSSIRKMFPVIEEAFLLALMPEATFDIGVWADRFNREEDDFKKAMDDRRKRSVIDDATHDEIVSNQDMARTYGAGGREELGLLNQLSQWDKVIQGPALGLGVRFSWFDKQLKVTLLVLVEEEAIAGKVEVLVADGLLGGLVSVTGNEDPLSPLNGTFKIIPPSTGQQPEFHFSFEGRMSIMRVITASVKFQLDERGLKFACEFDFLGLVNAKLYLLAEFAPPFQLAYLASIALGKNQHTMMQRVTSDQMSRVGLGEQFKSSAFQAIGDDAAASFGEGVCDQLSIFIEKMEKRADYYIKLMEESALGILSTIGVLVLRRLKGALWLLRNMTEMIGQAVKWVERNMINIRYIVAAGTAVCEGGTMNWVVAFGITLFGNDLDWDTKMDLQSITGLNYGRLLAQRLCARKLCQKCGENKEQGGAEGFLDSPIEGGTPGDQRAEILRSKLKKLEDGGMFGAFDGGGGEGGGGDGRGSGDSKLPQAAQDLFDDLSTDDDEEQDLKGQPPPFTPDARIPPPPHWSWKPPPSPTSTPIDTPENQEKEGKTEEEDDDSGDEDGFETADETDEKDEDDEQQTNPMWACSACTYEHQDEEASFLQCAACETQRPNTSAGTLTEEEQPLPSPHNINDAEPQPAPVPAPGDVEPGPAPASNSAPPLSHTDSYQEYFKAFEQQFQHEQNQQKESQVHLNLQLEEHLSEITGDPPSTRSRGFDQTCNELEAVANEKVLREKLSEYEKLALYEDTMSPGVLESKKKQIDTQINAKLDTLVQTVRQALQHATTKIYQTVNARVFSGLQSSTKRVAKQAAVEYIQRRAELCCANLIPELPTPAPKKSPDQAQPFSFTNQQDGYYSGFATGNGDIPQDNSNAQPKSPPQDDAEDSQPNWNHDIDAEDDADDIKASDDGHGERSFKAVSSPTLYTRAFCDY
jgi:hypothetical protein